MVSDGSQVMRVQSALAGVLNGLMLSYLMYPAVLHSRDMWPHVPWFYPVSGALLLAPHVWIQLRPRLRLTPAGLELLGRRGRRILWSEITRIEVEDKAILVAHLVDGQRVMLPAPCRYGAPIWDPRFPARVRQVADAWAAGLRVEPQPVPWVDGPPPKRRRRRAE